MSFEQTSGALPVPAYRDQSAANQLVPYVPGQDQVVPYTPKPSRMGSLANESGTKRYALFLPPSFSNTQNQPEIMESAYNSNRCMVKPKMSQVGLLIDIYA
ncbi:hypothetical protein D1AOALGA4SA_1249 [Olavius algarvensis Delta 1 endosymbiont]|nr:hypothetical protein D1AOALGA4SA_1249 [Olavius algarvensis Delta 1 endosymbiont]